jgi:hypothetical protein
MPRITGRYDRITVAGEEVRAFIPRPLPPAEPPLVIDDEIRRLARSAEEALARLELAGDMVPPLDWFIYAFVRKEAVVSSQIEGTQATLVDLLAFEADVETNPDSRAGADVQEVCNYLEALGYARAELARDDGLPLSMRLLNETHARLMQNARGADSDRFSPTAAAASEVRMRLAFIGRWFVEAHAAIYSAIEREARDEHAPLSDPRGRRTARRRDGLLFGAGVLP